MKVYLIETGQCCQCGTILRAYTKLSDCLAEFEHLQDVEKRKAWITVTYGLNEYDKTPGVIFGFWAGPTDGNTHANGWRVRELEVLEHPLY